MADRRRGANTASALEPRMEWMAERVCSSLKLKPEKFVKVATSDETREFLVRFLEQSSVMHIIFFINRSEELWCDTGFPTSLRRKSVVFLKTAAEGNMTEEKMAKFVVPLELGPSPVEHLSLMLREVFLPLLRNSRNHGVLPEVLVTDLISHLGRLIASSQVTIGQTKGHTLLPMPSSHNESVSSEVSSRDKAVVHSLESVVVNWIHQIKAALRAESDSVFADNHHAGPMLEIEFWRKRSGNLQSIIDQLDSAEITKVRQILQMAHSSYMSSFLKVAEDVRAALAYSSEINRYLVVLEESVQKLRDADDIKKLSTQFPTVLHTVGLIWIHCKHYQMPARLILLLRAVCNEVIELVTTFADSGNLFKMELPKALENVTNALATARLFKESFMKYKAQFSRMYPLHSWKFDLQSVFVRYDVFVARLSDVRELINTLNEFSRLEKIEIGGTKGTVLTPQVQQIDLEFRQASAMFGTLEYDVLDLNNTKFNADYDRFRGVERDLDRRLAAILVQGFDDCSSVQMVFKLVDSFDSLVFRELVLRDFQRKFAELIGMFTDELDQVGRVFAMQRDTPPVYANMPRAAGAVRWSRGLLARLEDPMQRIEALISGAGGMDTGAASAATSSAAPSTPSTPSAARVSVTASSEEMREMQAQYKTLVAAIRQFELSQQEAWAASVDERLEAKLQQALLVVASDAPRQLRVNFDPMLVLVLRESKYFDGLGVTIPDQIQRLYSKAESYYQFVTKLGMTVDLYNRVQRTIIEVERVLVMQRLSDIDQQLEKGIRHLDWKARGIKEFIDQLSYAVNELGSILKDAHGCVDEVEAILGKWSAAPLIDRKDAKRMLIPDDEKTKMQARLSEFQEGGRHIQKLLLRINDIFGVGKSHPNWNSYVFFVNAKVMLGFENLVRVSMRWLLDNLEPKANKQQLGRRLSFITRKTTQVEEQHPMLEVQLKLVNDLLVFEPGVDGEPHGLTSIFNDWTRMFFESAMQMRRLDNNNEDYFAELLENEVLLGMLDQIVVAVGVTEERCRDYVTSLRQYAFLWTTDREANLRAFLRSGGNARVYPDQDDAQTPRHGANNDRPDVPPELVDFETQIAKYETVFRDVTNLPSPVNLGWLRIHNKPVVRAISSEAKKWKFLFTDYLLSGVRNQIAEITQFVSDATRGMSADVPDDNYPALVQCMSWLSGVRRRTAATDAMWEPTRKKLDLLAAHEVEVPRALYESLDTLPAEWDAVKKRTGARRDELQPLIEKQSGKIVDEDILFTQEVREFRNNFKAQAPFAWDDTTPADAYRRIDEQYARILEKRQAQADLRLKQEMFELQQNRNDVIDDCLRELQLLKSVWDMGDLVLTQFAEWRETVWKDINPEKMEDDAKIYAKEIRQLPKLAKGWTCYTGLEAYVKKFQNSMPLVAELRSSAMRPRHWKQLMDLTNVQFTISNEFRLEDLLALNLDQFADDVQTIVDRAKKELTMEAALQTLSNTWQGFLFTFGQHSSGCPMLQVSEELVESLDDNQVQIQNMMASKFIAHFSDAFYDWKAKLSTVDACISVWMEVQRTWTHLESIFIGSADIRAQLPNDSKLFDGIDAEWKELMAQAAGIPNVVEVCNRKGFYEKLENLQSQLGVCEKALADYLETKRRVFPRFYFISSPDLLDILSKGNNPVEVMKHMPKLSDNIGKLEFRRDDNNEVTKDCVGMYSREGEFVPFHEPCSCTGPVEEWLNKLVDAMRVTLRQVLSEAVQAYLTKSSRLEWVKQFPAQLALVGVQISWSSEVNAAFDRLEEGNETALKEYNERQEEQLIELITAIQGKLDRGDRQKIMTICTIDVHSRDVIARLITEKASNQLCFSWQSQLRHRWDDEQGDCFANICDAQFRYAYEYLGNAPRLVITPLTDRCYITLTQSLHLKMGGAPAGPAGTGKTETTKDLGRALGVMVYVFNCSEQMDYKSLGNIFKGLSSSGSWGCFDEFNRIAVSVLSVVATQVKSILDALREKKQRFEFQGEEIGLVNTVGAFITMNPGYAGRTELPENIKALFRPVSMVVPDLGLICEIMLVAEGFVEARSLAKKFTTLYSLCRDLLSKQDHYDWGLRAIKAVLVVAGGLKRGEPEVPEEHVLMRALRDFNLPKIITEDVEVFMGLIGDLFPNINLPRKRNLDLEAAIKSVSEDAHLQAQDGFVLKCVQLDELLAVRHSVFVMGPSGGGKTQCWKMLAKSWTRTGRKTTFQDLNPKAVTSNELFGYINPQTREWKDGLFSIVMRDFAQHPSTDPRWIVLDGDIDPDWIESLNTVMDDNKVLTLASNERIPLHPHMRLLFEIAHLKYANPSTVSRAGILYINETDVGWMPFVKSWLATRPEKQAQHLLPLFEKYCAVALRDTKLDMRYSVPISDFNKIQTLVRLLTCMLTETVVSDNTLPDVYERFFVFAAIWSFGACLFQDQVKDYRKDFDKYWQSTFKTVKLPEQKTVYDMFVDPKTHDWADWTQLQLPYEHDAELPLQSALVHTRETARVKYFIDMFVAERMPLMLAGPTGCGKTALIRSKLASLSQDDYVTTSISFSFYTDSRALQFMMEQPLEKKTQKTFGPPGAKRLVYFIDDLNMPEVDLYGTQQPITLVRQHIDYSHWYDRAKMTIKEVVNVQYLSAMNPTAGSFEINTRLQRHFAVFGVQFPSPENLATIYQSILSQHLEKGGFNPDLVNFASKLITVSLELHARVTAEFLPTAINFHYQFNLRDLSNLFSCLLLAKPEVVPDRLELSRLYLHEAERVYGDRLVNEAHLKRYRQLSDQAGLSLEVGEAVNARPLVFAHFSKSLQEKRYGRIPTFEALNKLLEDGLASYNDDVAVMELVLFEDAMMHIARINRIIENPRGNALLIGVGGSGKQSLSRLAAYISGYSVVMITITKSYGINELKADLAAMYQRAGVKSEGLLFLFTDSQIIDERFLVYINDLLATGFIPDIFQPDEREAIINSIRSEVKANGLVDTNENCWDFFIDKVRRNLHVCLCFSPVGDAFRVRARKFPALANSTMIDWFHSWPEEALLSVARRFLEDTELASDVVRTSVIEFMAYAHKTVNELSEEYRAVERRHNYTTPKSFLELISLYKTMLFDKRKQTQESIDRLESGLIKLRSTTDDVAKLKVELIEFQATVAEKKKAADALLERVARETAIVQVEQDKASLEEEKMAVQAAEVSAKQSECQADLEKAEPLVIKALRALDTLDKGNLTELKNFAKPHEDVVKVMTAVMYLMAPANKVPKDTSWPAVKKFMGAVDQFLAALKSYDKENIPESSLKAARPIVEDKNFNGEYIRNKSVAAAGICEWAVNIVAYFDVYCFVQPKREALEEANVKLAAAQEVLKKIQDEVGRLKAKLQGLTDEFTAATDEKNRVIAQAEATERRLGLANRLVNGLSSENERWGIAVDKLRAQENQLIGDVLLASAFISYGGAFDKRFRETLVRDKWLPRLSAGATIPMTPGVSNPIAMLTNDALVARWNNEGLPTDGVSVQNATILTNCARWPLLVDPQLQGIKWIKTREAPHNLQIIRLTQPKYLDTLERAIQEGDPVLIENIGESLDAVLEPVISRNVIKRGRNLFIKLGDKEVDYNKKFRLILQTKLANPHYKPEIQAQCTLINFTVTELGLEDQLLALVVNKERPDLEEQKTMLLKQENEFKIRIKELEDDLLDRLAKAEGDILADVELIENLEKTKLTSNEIAEKVLEAAETSKAIDRARENYRPVASRSSLLYFLLNDLWKIHSMYQFSLKAFVTVFYRAIATTEACREESERVAKLIEQITYTVYAYTTRALFERHKVIFSAQLCFKIMEKRGDIAGEELEFLVRGKQLAGDRENPFEFIGPQSWYALNALREVEAFGTIITDMESGPKRWKEWCDAEKPEEEKLPGDWKNKSELQQLCLVRALRPDRVVYALTTFVSNNIGERYVESLPNKVDAIFAESDPGTPMFFMLSPGVDPVKEIEVLGRRMGFTEDNKNYRNVSLGQGQEIIAEQALDAMYPAGGWVVLQNIHLTAKWLPTLEKKLEYIIEHYEKLPPQERGDYEKFRLFLSAEPNPDPQVSSVSSGILQSSIKIVNEPPRGMRANIRRALGNFNQDVLESCSKQNEFRTVLFTLCVFHATVLERRKFGPQGWNIPYNFNTGDLTISVDVLYNYLESNAVIPWDDLRYIFGEIMYGGHISDDWDRRLCSTYLERMVRPALIEGDMQLAPGFSVPPPSQYEEYLTYVDESLPQETPVMFGLHPNAEIGFLTTQTDTVFTTILSMSSGSSALGSGVSKEEKVSDTLNDILGQLPEPFPMGELYLAVEELNPYISVCLQECARMNILTSEMRRSLKELALGIKGDLTMSARMEALLNALYMEQVPASWAKVAYPSLKNLTMWFADLLARIRQLEGWSADLNLPKSVWMSGLFNPQSFLTAIMQSTARLNTYALDKMCLLTDAVKRGVDELPAAPKDGAYVNGLFLEGARWDSTAGMLSDAVLKDLYPKMPVMLLRAVTIDKAETRDIYRCPVYKTRNRGPTFVWTFNLRSRDPEYKWILAGVSLLLSD